MDNEYQEEKILHDNDHSTTLVKEIKCSCQWTIYNFSFFAQGDNSCNAPNYAPDIESPLFKCGCNKDLMWDINIVNLKDLEDEYLKIYVYINDVEWYDYLRIDVKVSILDDKGNKAHTINYQPRILSTDSVNLIKKDYLKNKNNKLLNNDKLVIVCDINAFAEVYTYSWNAEIDENYQNEDKECIGDIYRHRLQVCEDLKVLIHNNAFDFTVVIKKKQFHVHKCILAAKSRVFSVMFEQEMLEQANNTVIITDISSKAFENIIDFIYSGTMKNINDVPSKILTEILAAADKYELNELKEICECIFSSQLLISNAVEMLKLADLFHADKLKKYIMQFIIAHKQDFISDTAFEMLLNTLPRLVPCFIQEKSEESAEITLDLTDDSIDSENTTNSCINHIHSPPANSLAERNQWSVTQVCTDECSCTWKINQIGLLFNDDMCDYIVSDKFSKDNINLSWQLFLYIKCIDNDTKDYVSLFVQFSDGNSWTYKIQAQYEFAIIDGKGQTMNKVKSNLLTFDVNNSKLGETKFIKKTLICNKKKNLLQTNDTLVIMCNVRFGLNAQKRFYQSDLLHYCKNKFLLAVSDDLEHLLESGKHSDITLSVSEKEFLVHSPILVARSPSLSDTISELFKKTQKKPVELNHTDPVVFKEMLLFIYSGKVKNLKELSKSLYEEARKFQLEDLKSICESYLCKNLTLENVCDNFVFAHINNVRKLRVKCSIFITDHLKAVISTAGYESLAESRPQLLKNLLLDRHNS